MTTRTGETDVECDLDNNSGETNLVLDMSVIQSSIKKEFSEDEMNHLDDLSICNDAQTGVKSQASSSMKKVGEIEVCHPQISGLDLEGYDTLPPVKDEVAGLEKEQHFRIKGDPGIKGQIPELSSTMSNGAESSDNKNDPEHQNSTSGVSSPSVTNIPTSHSSCVDILTGERSLSASNEGEDIGGALAQQQEKAKDGANHQCTICGTTFERYCNLVNHTKGNVRKMECVCALCGKEYPLSSCLRQHIIWQHDEIPPYECRRCGVPLKNKQTLTSHSFSHSGEKPFQCMLCEKQLQTSASLTNHMRTHTGEKPFQCSVCNKRFSHRATYCSHVRAHKNNGEKRFRCSICEKYYASSSALKIHMRTHTGKKPFQCNVCGQSFSQKISVEVHMRTHTDERPYSCAQCSWSFRRKSQLSIHMRRHTGEKPFECTVCGRQFAMNGNLSKHMRTHMGLKT